MVIKAVVSNRKPAISVAAVLASPSNTNEQQNGTTTTTSSSSSSSTMTMTTGVKQSMMKRALILLSTGLAVAFIDQKMDKSITIHTTTTLRASSKAASTHNDLLLDPNKAPIKPVNCTAVPSDTDPHMILHTYTDHLSSSSNVLVAAVDAPWWMTKERQSSKLISSSDDMLSELIFTKIRSDEIYIDVGANIGQTSMPALVSNNMLATYAFDPLGFDITKLCEGTKMNVQLDYTTSEHVQKNFFIFQSLVGNITVPEFNISRPDESFGRFEQSSIYGNTVGVVRKPTLVTETVPMVRLDDIIPTHLPIGLVKIDVQGNELPVVQGMHELLSKDEGYPHMVFYEEQKRVTQGAGFALGTVQSLLESYGYTCHREVNDILCTKPRKGEGMEQEQEKKQAVYS
jgi:FkbM family methyltransferase